MIDLIRSIRWENEGDKAWYIVDFDGQEMKIKDTNEIPLLGNDDKSKLWVVDHYGYLLAHLYK